MKIVIVIEDIQPVADNPANLDVKFMRMAKPEELANSSTGATEFADYMQMAADHYFKSRDKIKVITPAGLAKRSMCH